MAIARLQVPGPRPSERARPCRTRSSSTSAPTTRCCARAARRGCGCSSPRTGRWARACTRWPTATSSTSAPSCTRSAACPRASSARTRIVMGQDPELFARAGVGPLDDWEPVEAPARRRRWYDGGGDTLAVLLASASDVDDLVPTLVAFQIEWNKINQRMRTATGATTTTPTRSSARRRWAARPRTGCACASSGARRLRPPAARDRRAAPVAARADARRHPDRLRAHDAALVGAGARADRRRSGSTTGPSTSSARTPTACRTWSPGWPASTRTSSSASSSRLPEDDGLRGELEALRDARGEGSWENFLYFTAREFFDAGGPGPRERRRELEARGGRRAPLEPHRAARRRPDHPARLARPVAPRPAPGPRRRRPAGRERRP